MLSFQSAKSLKISSILNFVWSTLGNDSEIILLLKWNYEKIQKNHSARTSIRTEFIENTIKFANNSEIIKYLPNNRIERLRPAQL